MDQETKKMQKELLKHRYYSIVKFLMEKDEPACIEEIALNTEMTISQVKKAIQWGRRYFEEGKMDIRSYVLASGNGYFLPTRGREVVAYVVQETKTIASRSRTQKPLYEWAMKTYPEQMKEAMSFQNRDEYIDDEVNPWSVFYQIMQANIDFKKNKED